MEDNVKSFLDKIQELKDQKIKIDVHSLGKSIDCSPLSFKQQKDLISTIGDGGQGALKVQKIVNDIIISNTGNNDLKVTDKLGIILKLRIDAIGPKIKIGGIEGDITPVLQKVKTIKYPFSKTLKGTVEVSLEVPILSEETKIINAILETFKRDNDDLGKNIGNIYTYEIAKYIKTVTFGEDVLSFLSIPVKDRFKIVENLPLSTNKGVISFIQGIKRKETEVLTVLIDGEEKSFDIDVNFFDS